MWALRFPFLMYSTTTRERTTMRNGWNNKKNQIIFSRNRINTHRWGYSFASFTFHSLPMLTRLIFLHFFHLPTQLLTISNYELMFVLNYFAISNCFHISSDWVENSGVWEGGRRERKRETSNMEWWFIQSIKQNTTKSNKEGKNRIIERRNRVWIFIYSWQNFHFHSRWRRWKTQDTPPRVDKHLEH